MTTPKLLWWSTPGEYMYGDLDSAMTAAMGGVLRAYHLGIPKHMGGSGGYQVWKYVRPDGRGRAILRAPGCSSQEIRATVLAGDRTFAPGQRVSVGVSPDGVAVLGQPPSGVVGVSRFPVSEISGAVDQPRILSASPDVYPGFSDTVTFSGEQLQSGDTLTAQAWSTTLTELGETGYEELAPQWVDDPWVTISGEANVDGETMTATVVVTSASPWPRSVAVRVDRG